MTLKINDNGTDRDMTANEEALHLTFCEEIKVVKQKRQDVEIAKAVARQAVLDKLGLTADEAAALFG